MLIALDGIPLTLPKTGVGHYTSELARAIAQAAPNQQLEVVAPSNLSPIQIDETNQAPDNLLFKSISVGPLSRRWWSIGLPRYLRKTQIELFHGTNYEVPLWRPCATVITIHDLSLLTLPEKQQRRRVARARVRLPIMARAADAVIVPSEAVKSETCERFKLHATKVFVVPEAARRFFEPASSDEIAAVKARFGISDPFIFAVGTIEPRKNYLMLIDALVKVLKSRPDLNPQLVIAGACGWKSEEVLSRTETSPARERIVLSGYLTDVDLRALYSACAVSVYPSLYEGFGLPPLEAMACGAPVIASNIPSVAETVGPAACLLDPFDAQSWASNIIELIGNDEARSSLKAAGFKRVGQFSWHLAATKTLAVYEEALARWRNAVSRQ
jgi:glycosyltransferase involved in cell wall biosynthesis